MTNVSQLRREEMYARNAQYKQHRMAVPISDEQYLFWDDVLTNHFDKALEVYERLLAKTFAHCRTGCFDTGRKTRMKLKWGDKWLFAHRFTYALGVSLPLSFQQVVRHQCANFRCLNPAHIELGDQAQNFIDLKAAQAYGIRWELLPKAPLETIR